MYKLQKQHHLALFLLNLLWSIGGIYADWAWLSSLPILYVPFTAICSLYPPLLTIIFWLKWQNRPIPAVLVSWAWVGCSVYGLLALVYFPALIFWDGFSWYRFGSIFWVSVYGLQSFLLLPLIKNLRYLHLLWPVIFLLIANYHHYFLRTFWDFNLPNYPLLLKNGIAILALALQISAVFYLWYRKIRK